MAISDEKRREIAASLHGTEKAADVLPKGDEK